MSEENSVLFEGTEEPTPVVEVPKKKEVKKKDRSIDELDSLEPGKMTPSEMRKYIKSLREEFDGIVAKLKEREHQIDSSYRQSRAAQDELTALRHKYTIMMNFITGAVKTLSDSINLAVKGDIQNGN